eukprot:8261850-Pyramimonas_sp.AAC.1
MPAWSCCAVGPPGPITARSAPPGGARSLPARPLLQALVSRQSEFCPSTSWPLSAHGRDAGLERGPVAGPVAAAAVHGADGTSGAGGDQAGADG